MLMVCGLGAFNYIESLSGIETPWILLEVWSSNISFNYIESLSGIETSKKKVPAALLTFNYIESLSGIETGSSDSSALLVSDFQLH